MSHVEINPLTALPDHISMVISDIGESTNKYPANFELYDSSKIGISSGGLKRKDIIDSLTKYYGSPKSVGGKSYFTGNGVTLSTPIRQPRFVRDLYVITSFRITLSLLSWVIRLS